MVDGEEKMLTTIQNMIDKSLGKQPLANDSSAPMSSVAGTFSKSLYASWIIGDTCTTVRHADEFLW